MFFANYATMNTLFSSCFLIHVIIVVMVVGICAKKNEKKESKKEEPNNADDANAEEQRPAGGGNEHSSSSHRHFTPPHIATAAPGPSLLRPKKKSSVQKCPVHCQFSGSSSDDDDDGFVDSAHTSDISFDSTQPLSGVDHQQYLAQQCTCFCAAPKRVRFKCPTTSSLSFRRFI